MRGHGGWLKSRASALLFNGAAQNVSVRFGNVEPANITVVRQTVLPSIVVVVLALCMLAAGEPLTAEFYALALVGFLICAQIFSPLKLDRSGARGTLWRLLLRRLLEWSFAVAVLAFIAVSCKITNTFSRDCVLAWISLTPLALIAVDALSVRVVKYMVADRERSQRYVIIGLNEVGLELARRMRQGHGLGKFCGFIDYRAAERLSEPSSDLVANSCRAADLARFVRDNSITRVYITLPISKNSRTDELLAELRDTTASIYFVPNVFAFDLVQARCIEINGMPAFSICDSPLQGMSGVWKRMLDVCLAAFALLLLSPVLLAVALAIKQSSPGPVLFKQRRYGLNGEQILVYKFRTMTVWEDGPVIAQATRRDLRVTRIGAFLRRTSLDELPQILNVLEGKMSFVGPRPHAVAHNEEYRKLISGYMIRHKVRPGITGWAQVNGLRGETTSVEQMHERVRYDLDYLKHWSFWLDLRIILWTAVTVLTHDKAY
jgi:putative colanic acid biosynthesis UDP-glucose lipid carrier transferase